MNNGLITYLAALLLFGSNGIIAAAIALPSSDIVLLRTFLGAFSLVTILAITQRHKLQAPSRPREAVALILSGAALGASWIFLFRAYQTIGVGVSSLLYYCGPIIVMALSPFIFGEKLTGGKIAGFIAVACGAFLVAAQDLGGNMPIAGIVCGIASAFCYALMVIASKGAPHIEGLENSALQVSAAFVTALVLTLVTQGAPSFFSPGIAASIDWRAVAMLGVVNTGVGCLLYFSAVARLPVQTVAVVGYLEPLSAVVFSAILLSEGITPVRLMGAALIIGGAVFCELAGKRASTKAGIAQAARLRDIFSGRMRDKAQVAVALHLTGDAGPFCIAVKLWATNDAAREPQAYRGSRPRHPSGSRSESTDPHTSRSNNCLCAR